jgi:putative phosphoesterase
MRLVVVADTHIPNGSGRDLPDSVWRAVARADGVLHAGDVVGGELLDRLAERAPTWAVLGNNDVGLEGRLPETIELDLEGVRVAMVHDSGARAGRETRMARRFPAADVVVFGHSHIPVSTRTDRQLLFNPGSPTQRRRQPRPTYGELVLRDGTARARVIPL